MGQYFEPDIKTAFSWLSELPAKWTPVGWKDHLFRFNILYNGMISAVPDLNPRTKRWEGQGLQLGVYPCERPDFPGHVSDPQDNGSVVQGWRDCAAPVLFSEWAMDGVTFRDEVFGHIPGGKAVERGDEPLFAWVRLSIADLLPALPPPESYFFNLNLNAPYITVGAMSIRYNIAVDRSISGYPRSLSAEFETYNSADGLRILEPDGKVRMALAPGAECDVQVSPGAPTPRDFVISIRLDVRKGNYVDLLLPMLPVEREVFDRELAIGFDGALEQANRFWSALPATAATFDTPEPHINDAIRNNVKITEILGERNPDVGHYWLLTGSWAYADQWATPAALQAIMLLDAMGYHESAEKYLRVYVEDQGSVVPQGDYFAPHPGSFGPPKFVAACDWTSDHGAILWALAQHALLTQDSRFIDYVLEPLVLGCEYVQFLRRTEHEGVPRLVPPGIATDMPTKIQSVWADAFTYKGLATAVKLLRRLGHPRADEFASEAEDYRQTFVSALRTASKKMPQWTDDDGNPHHLVPLAVYNEQPFEYRNAFYLDTGPLVLVWAGLLDADDEMMSATLKWFREGPPTKVYRYDSDCWQVPSLHHEMSSCEPVFSWNVFHSHQLGDRNRFLEGMYSLFAGSVSRQTYTMCETRGGVTGVTGAYLPAFMARLAVVDDQAMHDELHLLRMMPLAWLREDRESVFDNMPTEFGPVSLHVRLGKGGKQLLVDFDHRFHTPPYRIVLHIPPLDTLEDVVVNGRSVQWDRTVRKLDVEYC